MDIGFQPWFHPLFEILGYAAGYALYRGTLHRNGERLDDDQGWAVIAAASIGALLGSRILGLMEQAPRLHFPWSSLLLPGGRTMVGGLLGGWMAVAVCKPLRGMYTRTGDLFAVPLCLGIAVGRIGCLLSGLADGTEGRPTGLPWGIDFGDGIVRHPTPIYEILFLTALALILHRYQQRPHPHGSTIHIFMAAYLAWRLLVDFIKPEPVLYRLSVIQWACVAGLLVLLARLMRRLPIAANAVGSTP